MSCFESNGASLKLETGWLCLDFANTARWHASVRPKEELQSYRDLISWGRQIHLLTEPEAQRLLEEADRHPAEATAALERAILLREAVYRIFSAVTHGENPKTEDLALLNQELRESLAHAQIVPTDHRFRWSWMSTEDILDWMLWPVMRSTADLLTSEILQRVGECADDRGCGWLFFDTSRNRTRQWCSMKDCGNRAKARRYCERERRPQAHE